MKSLPLLLLLVTAAVPARAGDDDASVAHLRVAQNDATIFIEVATPKGWLPNGNVPIAHGDRIDFMLGDIALGSETLSVTSELVKRVDIVAGPPRRVSIQMHGGRESTAQAAAAMSVTPQDGVLRFSIPRSRAARAAAAAGVAVAQPQPPAPAAAAPAPPTAPAPIAAPTQPVAAAAPVAPAPAQAPAQPVTTPPPAQPRAAAEVAPPQPPAAAPASVAAVIPAAAPIDSATAIAAAPHAVAPAGPNEPALALATGVGLPVESAHDAAGVSSDTRNLVIFGLALAAGGLWYFMRRRGVKMPLLDKSIHVLSSQNVGPKTRLVLVDVGGRQMLLSVSDKGARMLTKWHALAPGGEAVQPKAPWNKPQPQHAWKNILAEEETPSARDPKTPLVAGISRLREAMRKSAAEGAAAPSPTAKAEPNWAAAATPRRAAR